MAAYSVSKRLKELRIRVVLGARRRQVLQTALGRAFRLLAIGSAARIALWSSLHPGARVPRLSGNPRDPLVLAGVVLAMALLGLAATWIPAQRALSVDPIVLLRDD
jgi:ABC-type antimicrobial peptide transport system permease subunit